MAINKQTVKQREDRPAGRDAYARPKLQEFGSVGALTQSGTDEKTENAQNQGTMRNRP